MVFTCSEGREEVNYGCVWGQSAVQKHLHVGIGEKIDGSEMTRQIFITSSKHQEITYLVLHFHVNSMFLISSEINDLGKMEMKATCILVVHQYLCCILKYASIHQKLLTL